MKLLETHALLRTRRAGVLLHITSLPSPFASSAWGNSYADAINVFKNATIIQKTSFLNPETNIA